MTGGISEGNLKIIHVFDKIGAMGKLFSDERLLDILKATLPNLAFVDCPLSEPPCVSCQRPSCPGVDACDDIGVAFMQSIVNTNEKGRKRKRPINPQTQRLWDVKRWAEDSTTLQEPSYSANMAPLVVRAKTLQRRLFGWKADFLLRETSVPLSLRVLAQNIDFPMEWAFGYRSFGIGKDNRSKVLEALIKNGYLSVHHSEEIIESSENFHSMICALIACMFEENMVELPGPGFSEEQGWVYLPELKEKQNIP